MMRPSIQRIRSQIRAQILHYLQLRCIPHQVDKQNIHFDAGRLEFTSEQLHLHPSGKASRYLPYQKVRLSQLDVLLTSQQTNVATQSFT